MEENEKSLYSPIERYFQGNGYFAISDRTRKPGEKTHSAFGVDVHGIRKRVDVVAFKWLNAWEVEAYAVECKPGSTWEAAGSALGQATAYQRLFPKVYVASRATDEKLEHVESLLRQLGLGYIMAKDDGAEEMFPPSENIRFSKHEFNRQVRLKAMALLAHRDVYQEENPQYGGAQDISRIWVASKSIESCNMFTHVSPDEVVTGLNIEKKRSVYKIMTQLDVDVTYKLIGALDRRYEISVRRYFSHRPTRLEELEGIPRRAVSDISRNDLQDITDRCRSFDWDVNLQVLKKINNTSTISNRAFTDEIKAAKIELFPLYRYVTDFVKRRGTSAR